jgi:hypothetical protein
MSRSYRKHAKIGRSNHSSERSFKTLYNRKTRSKVKNIINSTHVEELDYVNFPTKLIEMADVWDSVTDGPKMYFGDEKCARQSGYRLDVEKVDTPFTVTLEWFEKLFTEGHASVTPELYKYLRDRFDEEGEFEWSTYKYEVKETLEEFVKDCQEYYKKYMRK